MSGPKRYQSDTNFRIPPEVLAKVSESNAPPPALAEAMLAAQDGPPRTPPPPCSLCAGEELEWPSEDTKERCPKCGEGMVRPDVARAYQLEHPAESYVEEAIEIDLTTDPDEEGSL